MNMLNKILKVGSGSHAPPEYVSIRGIQQKNCKLLVRKMPNFKIERILKIHRYQM